MTQSLAARDLQLAGRAIITGSIRAITGLRVGSSDKGIGIGDAAQVLRDPLTNRPYIPGRRSGASCGRSPNAPGGRRSPRPATSNASGTLASTAAPRRRVSASTKIAPSAPSSAPPPTTRTRRQIGRAHV